MGHKIIRRGRFVAFDRSAFVSKGSSALHWDVIPSKIGTFRPSKISPKLTQIQSTRMCRNDQIPFYSSSLKIYNTYVAFCESKSKCVQAWKTGNTHAKTGNGRCNPEYDIECSCDKVVTSRPLFANVAAASARNASPASGGRWAIREVPQQSQHRVE